MPYANVKMIMTKINLSSNLREEVGKKIGKKRAEGKIPAVVYGHGIKPKNLWINNLDLTRVYREVGENTIIELEAEDKKKMNVLIQEIQSDPVSGNFIHVDFFQVRMDEKIEKEVPLEFIGEAPAVKESGGILIRSLDEIPVKCLPADLPSKIDVDISALKTFDDYIKAKDLPISNSVQIQIDPETIVALVAAPRSDEEMAKLDEKVEEDVTKVAGVVKEKDNQEEKSEK
jgi:large subunit ribosomal protein L25